MLIHSGGRLLRRPGWAWLLAAAVLLAPVPGRPQEDAVEVLLPGPPPEHPIARPIAAGEKRLFRLDVADVPLLVTVDQQSIDLVVEARGPAGETLSVGAGGDRWGPEVLLLAGAGERRLEVRPKDPSVWPGRYTIGVEPLADFSTAGTARQQALGLMSRAGQEAFAETREARQQAAATYREALAAWRALGDRRWEAEALHGLALLEQMTNELRPALADHERALALWRELGEPEREAATLNLVGMTRLGIGEGGAAREALEGAASLWHQLGRSLDEAETRSNLCYLEQTAGALPAALACYAEPRAAFKAAGHQMGEQAILNNLGGIYELLGEPDAALDHYQQALALRHALGNRRLEAQSLNNIAVIHRTLGEWQEALRLYGQAREILAPLGDRSFEAAVLHNVGAAYNSLGEPQRALAFLEQALEMRRTIGERLGEVITLNGLGSAWRKLGEPAKALDQHRRALELAVALGDARQEALTRVRISEVQLEQGEPQAALRELEPALPYLQGAGLQAGAQARQLQGQALARAGRPREALPVLEEVLARRRTLRDRAGEAETLTALAVAQRSLGLPQEARANAEAAVARVEELRTGFVSPELRAAFLATQRRAYSLLIDLLMDRHAAEPAGGWDRAALAASEQARARNLLDALNSGGAGRGGSAVPPRCWRGGSPCAAA
jgi:tetratricopeptide (TPR) repeat protein